MVQEQMIPHWKALILDILILEEEGRGIVRGLPRPLFVKSVLFRKKGCGNLLRCIKKALHNSFKCMKKSTF